MATEPVVLDASAILALLYGEPGAEVVDQALDSATVSAINLAEVIASLQQRGWSETEIDKVQSLRYRVVDFDRNMGVLAGKLAKNSRRLGLSLGDRACFATAAVLGIPTVLTADRVWEKMKVSKVKVQRIR